MARKMKDSGVEWIGQIPFNWDIDKIGQIYSERKEKVSDRDYAPLSVTMKGILPQLSTAAKSDAHDDRKLLCEGDFAINSRSDRRGSCGISPCDGSVSLINIILRPKEKMNPNYYNWLFHTSMFADEFYKWGHGIVDDLWTTNWSDMKNIVIPSPSLDEQQRIADYLDAKVAKIDETITKTRSTIEEYKALKQSIITQAVTKGVRGDRPMRNSGIEWIGEIPEEWKECRFYSILSVVESLVDPTLPEYKNLLHVGPGNIEKMTGKLLECITAEAEGLTSGKYVFDENCIVYGKINPQLGKVCIPGFKGLCSADAYAFRVISNDNIRYIYYQLLSLNFYNYSVPRSFRMGMPKINREELSQYKFLIPSNSEQMEIVDYLDRKCASIDNIISKKEQLISELESYKKSLIYEYVTGKKEVPGYGN